MGKFTDIFDFEVRHLDDGSIEIFDFFPKTPYFETLVVLDKKNLANSTQPSN